MGTRIEMDVSVSDGKELVEIDFAGDSNSRIIVKTDDGIISMSKACARMAANVIIGMTTKDPD